MKSSRHLAIRPVILALSLAFASPSHAAQPSATEFNITTQPLGQALNELARQAGMVLLADSQLMAGRQSPTLKGQYSVRDALRQVLAGSGLRAELNKEGTILLKAEPNAKDKTIAIGAVRISGAGSALIDEDQIDPADLPYVKSGSSVHISQEQIERFRGTSPADIFKGTPGVQVGDARNSGAVDINIRGMQGQGRVPVIIDGSMQSTTIYRGYAGVADRNYIDPDLISSIQIEKGPSLSAQGTGAVGGLVLMQTLNVQDIIQPGEHFGARLRLGTQSNSISEPSAFTTQKRSDRSQLWEGGSGFGSIALGVTEDHYDLVAALSHRQLGNYFSGKNGEDRYRVLDRWGKDSGVTQYYKGGEEVLNTSNTSTSALLKADLRLPADQTLQLGYRYFASEFGEIMPSQINRNSKGFIPQWEPSSVNSQAWTARYAFKPKDNPLINLKANLWYTDTQNVTRNGDVFSNPLQGKTEPKDNECPSCVETLYLADTQSQRIGADLSNSSHFSSPIGEWHLNYGISSQQENIGPGKNVNTTQADINTNRTLREGSREENSIFLNMNWAPTSWLSFDLGGRYQRYQTEDQNVKSTQQLEKRAWQYVLLFKKGRPVGQVKWYQDENGQFNQKDNPAVTGQGLLILSGKPAIPLDKTMFDRGMPMNNVTNDPIPDAYAYSERYQRDDSGFAPSFGINLKFNDQISAYARYAQGLRMPSLFESTLGFSAAYLQPLEPERTENLEVGISYIQDSVFNESDKLRLKLAYFDNTTRDYITRRQIVTPTGDRAFALDNVPKFSVSGFELQSAYDMGSLFFDLSATLYQDTETCDPKTAGYIRALGYSTVKNTPDCTPVGHSASYMRNHIPPEISANLTLGGRLFDQRLVFGSRVAYVGGPLAEQDPKSRWQNAFGTSDQLVTKSYTLVDLFASYQWSKESRFNFTVDNLTDRYYLDALSLSLMPAPGRTMRLSFETKF